MKRTVLLGAAVAACLLTPGVREAAAQTQTCQNTISLPGTQTATYSIGTKGIYCLATDVILASGAPAGVAIEIAADHVVLDLNGHRVGGGSASAAIGIHSNAHKDVTVKNGTVRGFHTGIRIEDGGDPANTRGTVVENIQAEANKGSGINAQGQGLLVRGNRVIATGDGQLPGVGIWAKGPGARVVDNQVVDTVGAPGFDAWGIVMDDAPGAVVEGNQVTNAAVPAGIDPTAIMIKATATNVLVVGNRLTGWSTGVDGSTTTGSKCRDSLFANVATTIDGCTDAGNNN